jgi:hypothetical protein
MYFRTFIHFVKKNTSDSTKKLSETDINNMFKCLIDNIFVIFGGRVFQQTVGIAMGTNCAPPLAYLFLFVGWGNHHTGASQEKRKEASSILYFTFRYIDDVCSLNNSRFGDFVDRLYSIELEINDTTDRDRSASYLDLHLKIDRKGRLRTDTLRQKK